MKAMEYKFTIVFDDLRDFEQVDEYTDKIAEFIDSELTKEWCAFVERVNCDGEVHRCGCAERMPEIYLGL